MTAKEIIFDARSSLLQIKTIREQLLIVHELQEAPRQPQLDEVHAQADNRLEKLTEAVMDYEQSLHEVTAKYIKACQQAEKYINALPQTEAIVIRNRYLLGKSWEEVADTANYSGRQCQRFAADALERLEKMS